MNKLIALALILFMSLAFPSCATIATINSNPQLKPSTSEWTYELDTADYIFLTKNMKTETYKKGDKTFNKYTLTTFYSNDFNAKGVRAWVFHKETIPLDEQSMGPIKVINASDIDTSKSNFIVPVNSSQTRNMSLKLIKNWAGTTSQKLNFKANTAPWVVNASARSTSNISSSFNFYVWKDLGNGISSQVDAMGTKSGVYNGCSAFTVDDTGSYILEVQCSGCTWVVIVGTE